MRTPESIAYDRRHFIVHDRIVMQRRLRCPKFLKKQITADIHHLVCCTFISCQQNNFLSTYVVLWGHSWREFEGHRVLARPWISPRQNKPVWRRIAAHGCEWATDVCYSIDCWSRNYLHLLREIVNILLEYAFPIEKCNYLGETPLHVVRPENHHLSRV